MLVLGVLATSSDAANALNIPPGEYGRKVKLKGIDGDPHNVEHCLIRRYAKNLTWP